MKKDCSECEYFDEFHTSRVCHDCKPWGESAEAVQIHNDGTLEVKVPNAQKVGRVLVMDTESHIGGGLFYPESAEAEWIPCSERMPNNKTYVLTTIQVSGRQPHARSGFYHDGFFHNDNGDTWRATDREVTAWMPLPKPYKGGTE